MYQEYFKNLKKSEEMKNKILRERERNSICNDKTLIKKKKIIINYDIILSP